MQFRSVACSRGAVLFLLLFSVQGSLQNDSIGDQRIKQLDVKSGDHEGQNMENQSLIMPRKAAPGDSQGSPIGNRVSGSVEFPKAASDSSHSESIERQGSRRLSRATPSEFSSILDQISAGARLVSAISLINGLVDKSITPNTAITELLSIGDVDVDKLKTFDKQNVVTAVQKLVALQPSVAPNSVSADLEKMMVLLESWRQQYKQMGDVKDTEAAKEYFDDVQKSQGYVFSDYFFSVSDFDKMTDPLESIINAGSVRQNHMDDLNNVVKETIPFAVSLANDLSNVIEALQQFEKLTRRDFILDSPQRMFMNLLNELGNSSTIVGITNPTGQQEFKGDATTVYSSLSGPAGDDLFHPGEIASSQLPSARFASKMHTSGLLNGYVDLGKVDVDVVNPTMEPLFGPFNKTVLKQGLAPLKAVAAGAADVYNEWSQLMTPQSMSAAEKLGQVTRWFGALKTPITDETVTNVVRFGAQAPPSIGFSSEFNTLLEKAISLRSVLPTVLRKAEILQKSQSLKDLDLATEMRSYLPNAPIYDSNNLEQKHIDTFQNFTDRHKVLAALKDLKPKFQEISDYLGPISIGAIVQDLYPDGLDVMNRFLGHADFVKVVTYFDGLNGISKDVKSCSEMVQLIRQIRTFSSNQAFVQQLGTMSDAVLASLPQVASLLSVTSKIVTDQEEKVKKLAKLQNLNITTKNLGDSLMALYKIKSVMEKKTDLNKFIEKGYFIDGELSTSTSPNKTQMTADWSNFNETARQLNRTLIDLENRTDSLVTPNGTTFSSFEPVFLAFKGLQSVNLDVEKRLKVLEELLPNSYAREAKQYLDGLKLLDLNFETFTVPLSRISATLSFVDSVFSFTSLNIRAPSPPAVPNSPAAVNTSGPSIGGNKSALQSGQSTSTTSSFPWAIVGCVLLVILVVAVAAGTTMFFIKRKKAKMAGKGDLEGKSKSAETEKKSGFRSRLFKKEKPAKNELSKSPAMSPKERADFSPSQSESFGSSIEAK